MINLLKDKVRYLLVFISLILVSFSVLGFGNVNGLFYDSFVKRLNITISTYSIINAIAVLLSGLFSHYFIRILNYIKVKYIFLISCILNIIVSYLLAISNSLIIVSILLFIKNIINYCIGNTVITIIINNWFSGNTALVISIVMVFTGLGGGFISPIISNILEKYGFIIGYVTLPILILVFCFPTILFVKLKPEEIGLKPYYIKVKKEERDYALKSKGTVYIAIFCLLVIGIANIYSFVPLMIEKRGYSTSLGAYGLSMVMYGNVISKLLFGFINDKIGLYKTISFMLMVCIIGLGGLISLNLNNLTVTLFGILYGFAHSISSVGIPLYVRSNATKQMYPETLAKIIFYDNVCNNVIKLIASLSYDCFKTYIPAFIFSIICGLSALIYLNKKEN